MSSFRILGGKNLKGEINPQGAKNETLQVLCAVLLTEEKVKIENIPNIKDVNLLIDLIKGVGVNVNKINETFEGNFKINYHLSPPIFCTKDKVTGYPLKINFGSWIMILFKFISMFKFLRGTYFDLFGYFEERKIERLLINNYKDRILEICSKLTIENYALAVEIASIPDQIRGFGYIKKKNIEIAKNCENKLMSMFNG